jgi:hypothetical protein
VRLNTRRNNFLSAINLALFLISFGLLATNSLYSAAATLDFHKVVVSKNSAGDDNGQQSGENFGVESENDSDDQAVVASFIVPFLAGGVFFHEITYLDLRPAAVPTDIYLSICNLRI